MNVLDGFKTLYTAGGGQENLDELQGNKDQNMHSVIYGDGLDTTLPSNIENDVLSIAKGGGSGLPEVTSEDNGKVLTVIDGRWDKEISNGVVVFEGIVTDSDSMIVTVSMSYNDVINANFSILKVIEAGSNYSTINYFSLRDTHFNLSENPAYTVSYGDFTFAANNPTDTLQLRRG